jgi:manganese/iron transport system permease protein/iron/zinc/copper transport system permease protein
MQVLGVTLIAAALVVPAVVARLVNDSFGKMLVLSGVIGALCGLVGMYVSFHVNVASGATIVLVAATLFTVVFAVTGIASRRRLQVLAPAPGTAAPIDID